jgi:hypothetical protein
VFTVACIVLKTHHILAQVLYHVYVPLVPSSAMIFLRRLGRAISPAAR